MARRRVVDGPDPEPPAGWQGGSRSFGFVRTFDGHRSLSRFSTTEWSEGDFERCNPMGVDTDDEADY